MFFMLLAGANLGLALLSMAADKPEDVRFYLLMAMLSLVLAVDTGGC